MADIGVVIEGDRQVALKFEQFPAQCHDALLSRITSLTEILEARVAAAVPVKTGKLRSEVTSQVYDDQTSISGRVTIDGDSANEYAKAGALEWGAHNSTKVAAHNARLDHIFSRRLSAPIDVMVEAHSRQLDIVAVKFLRGPFQADEQAIADQLQQAVDETIGD